MRALLITVGFALIAMGLVLGFIPVTIGDRDVGDGFACGSAFFVNSEGLTDTGHETCEIDGGAAGRRIWAFALFAAGVVFIAGGVVAQADNRAGSGAVRQV